MRILEMSLENFQGVRQFAFSPQGHNCSIYGDNGAGKTTIFNAFTWLLYGKASTGEKGYTPKTTGSHNVNHIAEALLQMDNGTITRIRKDYHEVYKTVKGSAHAVLTGHTTDHYIDGVPVKESVYNAFIKDACGDGDIAKMITMPEYFLQDMHPSDRRKVLLEVCGDVSMSEVIAKNKELAELTRYLQKPGNPDDLYDPDEYKAIAKKAMSSIDKELQSLPARIDEVEKSKPDIAGIDIGAVESQVETLKQVKRTLEEQRAATGSTYDADVRKKIAQCEEKMAVAAVEFNRAEVEKNRAANAELARAHADELNARQAYNNVKIVIEECEMKIHLENRRLHDIAKEWKAADAMEWNEPEFCPTCGQRLPQDQIDTAKKKFNLNKSERLEELDRKGCEQAEKIEQLEDKKKEAETELIQIHEPAVENARRKSRAAREAILPDGDINDVPEYKELEAEKSRLMAALLDAQQASKAVTADIDAKISEIEGQISDLMRNKSDVSQIERLDQRIKELEEQESELAKQYEDYQRGVYLCELYTREKAKALDEKINSKFETLHFRLFIEQQNGGITDDCEALIPCEGGRMVPFKSANNAARINAGLELIDTLSRHYGTCLPVFVDNAESVVRLRGTDTQVIRLVVSEDCPKLHFELDI